MGAIPVSFEIEAESLDQAVSGYAAAAKQAVERTVRLTQKYRIDGRDLDLRLRWVDFTEADAERVRAAATYLRPRVPEIVRAFYDHSFGFPPFVEKLDYAGSNRSRLEQAQQGYLLGLLDAHVDDTCGHGSGGAADELSDGRDLAPIFIATGKVEEELCCVGDAESGEVAQKGRSPGKGKALQRQPDRISAHSKLTSTRSIG